MQEAGALEELLSRGAPVRAAADYLDFLASHPEYDKEMVKDLVAKRGRAAGGGRKPRGSRRGNGHGVVGEKRLPPEGSV